MLVRGKRVAPTQAAILVRATLDLGEVLERHMGTGRHAG